MNHNVVLREVLIKPATILIIGAGDRGKVYAGYAEHFPEKLQIIGVAEPRKEHRELLAKKHNIPRENIFSSWQEAAAIPRFADAVVIATQDKMHTEPALAFANLGYHLLLEKPMAPTPDECRKIVAAVENNKIIFAVCHVLRYTNYTQKLKQLIADGKIGDIVSIQRLEPVGYWHQAHSYVRGNWRREAESNFMLLAKSCHDLDWIRYLIGSPFQAVSSFGNLKHFRKENQPEGAAARCLDCSAEIESNCPYSALKIYLGFWEKGIKGWPVSVLTPNPTKTKILRELQIGPYGRCVYNCDNDVVDHQVVNMEFVNGCTACFTMTAFTKASGRRTRIFGSRGEIEGDGRFIKIHQFLTDREETIDTQNNNGIMQQHGGGDFGLMENFVNALLTKDPSKILTGARESLESHLAVFAAEKARRENMVVQLHNSAFS